MRCLEGRRDSQSGALAERALMVVDASGALCCWRAAGGKRKVVGGVGVWKAVCLETDSAVGRWRFLAVGEATGAMDFSIAEADGKAAV